jgi:hypothetical protein
MYLAPEPPLKSGLLQPESPKQTKMDEVNALEMKTPMLHLLREDRLMTSPTLAFVTIRKFLYYF